MWTVKEKNSYVIHIRRSLITEEKWVCLSEIRKKIAIKSIEMFFCFQFYVLLGTSPIPASLWEWFYFDEPSNHERSVTNNKKYNNEEMKMIQLFLLYFNLFYNYFILVLFYYYYFIIIIGLYGLFYYYNKAIRTRTVDLLGKRDRTDSYQNDSNSFKDPTCIFFALGSFINWYKY